MAVETATAPIAPTASAPAAPAVAVPAAATETAAAPAAPAPPKPAPPKRSTDVRELLDQALDAHDATTAAEVEAKKTSPVAAKPATGEKPASDAPPTPAPDPKEAKAEPATEKPVQSEQTDDAEDAEPIPQKVGEALKAIQDPKVRAEIRGDVFLAKAYKELGTISELKELKQLAPTIEVAREAHHVATRAHQLREAFVSGHPEGVREFAEALRLEAPDSYEKLAQHLLGGNEALRINERTEGVQSLIARFRGHAHAKEDVRGVAAEDFERVAEILESYLGITQAPRGQRQQPVAPPEVQQELEALRAREAQRSQAEQKAWLGSVQSTYQEQFGKEVQTVLKASDPDGLWPPQATQRLATEITNAVMSATRGNPQLGIQTKQLILSGAPRERVVQHLINNARGLLAPIARDTIAAYRAEWTSMRSERERRQGAAEQRRDIGTTGTAVRAATPPTVQLRPGMSVLDKINAFLDAT